MNTFVEIGFGIFLVGLVTFLIVKNKNKILASLQKRTEKNAVKVPNIHYIDTKGENHTEDIVIKRSNLPLIGDWSRVYPVINEDGSWNWVNAIFGGRRNLIKLIILLGIVAMILFAFAEFFASYEALKNSCIPINNLLR